MTDIWPSRHGNAVSPASWRSVVGALRRLPKLDALLAATATAVVELHGEQSTLHAIAFEPLEDQVFTFVGVRTANDEEPDLHRLEAFVAFRDSGAARCMTLESFERLCNGDEAREPHFAVEALRVRDLARDAMCVGAVHLANC